MLETYKELKYKRFIKKLLLTKKMEEITNIIKDGHTKDNLIKILYYYIMNTQYHLIKNIYMHFLNIKMEIQIFRKIMILLFIIIIYAARKIIKK